MEKDENFVGWMIHAVRKFSETPKPNRKPQLTYIVDYNRLIYNHVIRLHGFIQLYKLRKMRKSNISDDPCNYANAYPVDK